MMLGKRSSEKHFDFVCQDVHADRKVLKNVYEQEISHLLLTEGLILHLFTLQ